ncbi:uncharacterized protein LOC120761631 [Hirundo rustica]|uniref:uncharacterized protein LOC120761631 n=1 Tax=Hirundo rustica TaxID=43150 RepID=UPI001A9513C6|nr:uncharacterized protein LOC120761631 [Hirundo rustica]
MWGTRTRKRMSCLLQHLLLTPAEGNNANEACSRVSLGLPVDPPSTLKQIIVACTKKADRYHNQERSGVITVFLPRSKERRHFHKEARLNCKVDPIEMAQQTNPRALSSPWVERVEPDSQTQPPARPRPVRSRRRRQRQTAPASRGGDEPRTFQVYKFSSRAPPVSAHNGGSSQIPALPDDGNVMGMMARSARYWVRRETPRCWVRGCTCACSETELEEVHLPRSRLLPSDLDEDHSSTSLTRGGLFSRDEDNDGSVGDTATASSWAGVRSDDGPRSFAEEYALVPLSRRKQYTAQTFHEAVERFLRGF